MSERRQAGPAAGVCGCLLFAFLIFVLFNIVITLIIIT